MDNLMENTQQDTQENAFEAAFGVPQEAPDSNNVEPFGEPQETGTVDTASPELGVPETTQVQAQPEPQADPNEQQRYQYWQSEADKRTNELSETKRQNDLLQNQMNIMMQQQQQPQQAEQPVQEEEQGFPPPPEKPEKPHNFSREEALSDPNSDSARYLDAQDEHRDTMDEYNQLHQQWTYAKVQEDKQKFYEEQQRVAEIQRQQSEADQNRNSAIDYAQKTFQATPEQAQQFVKDMSSRESISMDNLWQLWLMRNNQQVSGNVPPKSDSFQQVQNAQQVPSPMGVVPAVNSGQTDPADSLMDGMIADYNRQNPFG
jgi:hypothetical protein